MSNESYELRSGVVHCDGDTTVWLGGELDLASAAELVTRLDALAETSAGTVTLDLTDVTFIDSTGLVAILAARQRIVEAGRQLKVRNPSRPVQRVLELSGAETVLDIDVDVSIMDPIAD